MMLTLFTLNWLQSPAFPLHVSTQHLNIKENVLTSTTPFLLLQTQLSSTSFLLLGAFSGKVPCSISTKTYYFWQVSRFPCDYIASLGPWLPFWATAEVVPWLLAPETGDMAQVLPGIQSTSLPGLFCHTLLPLSRILLDSHSYNFGRCDLLLHMNSMTWCRL